MEGFDCEVISEILGVKGRGRVGDTRGELETPREKATGRQRQRLEHKDCQRLPGVGRGTGRTLLHSLPKKPSLLTP